MHLVDIIAEADVVLALEPDELGIRMLRSIEGFSRPQSGVMLDVGSYGQLVVSAYPAEHHAELSLAVREAWAWLEGAALLIPSQKYMGAHSVRELSRRAVRLLREPDLRRALSGRSLSQQELHPAIREEVWSLFLRGKYDTAVFEAMKTVEVNVRAAARLDDSWLGVKLMREAFAPGKGKLTDHEAEGGEQVGRMEMFAGAIASYKNPQSHRHVRLSDPEEAAEIIMLASHLLRIVDARGLAYANSWADEPDV